MVSALAGYVEPGETVEEACARELHEEVGVVATSMRYLASQPWPFPSSLMIGLIADVTGGPLIIDHNELEDARWFTREEARALVEGRHGEFTCPPPLAIAHHLIKAWAYE
jgi:NAD+ diphosphatase